MNKEPSQTTNLYLETPSNLSEQILEHRGCPIHYWTGGREGRPLLVFMHGALMDHRMFNAQVAHFADNYQILVWDARGHGKSQPVGLPSLTIDDYVGDMMAVLERQNAETVFLVGQSLGAYISQHLIRQYPKRSQALVVIGSTPIAVPVKTFEMAALRFSTTIYRVWPWQLFINLIARTTTINADVAEYVRQVLPQVGRENMITIWGAVSTAVRKEGYPDFSIDIPLLLTHGDQDITGTFRRDAPGWAASDPRIQYHVIPNAGHNANQDNVEFFNRLLEDFIGQIKQSQTG